MTDHSKEPVEMREPVEMAEEPEITVVPISEIETKIEQDEETNSAPSKTSYLAVGMGLGVAFGIIFDNLSIGIALGVAFGLGIDAMNARKNKS